jgi:hypothetical protein
MSLNLTDQICNADLTCHVEVSWVPNLHVMLLEPLNTRVLELLLMHSSVALRWHPVSANSVLDDQVRQHTKFEDR